MPAKQLIKTTLLGHNQSMGFWQELRRRRVYRMSGFYVVGAWLIHPGCRRVLPRLGSPGNRPAFSYRRRDIVLPDCPGIFLDLRHNHIGHRQNGTS